MSDDRATRDFFRTDAPTLARRLLGQRLVRVLDSGERLAGLIVETEAYIGVRDRASHAFAGRRTKRTETMYAQAGTAYVYFTYGMHNMFNVVCGEVGEPVAVLVRALRPTEGLASMRQRRSRADVDPSGIRETELCSGPGKLCSALSIDRALDRIDLVEDERLFIETVQRAPLPPARLRRTPRIRVDGAGEEWASAMLRWHVRNDAHVSRR